MQVLQEQKPVSAIIQTVETEFLADYQDALLPSQRQALAAMTHCRTSQSPVMLAQYPKVRVQVR